MISTLNYPVWKVEFGLIIKESRLVDQHVQQDRQRQVTRANYVYGNPVSLFLKLTETEVISSGQWVFWQSVAKINDNAMWIVISACKGIL